MKHGFDINLIQGDGYLVIPVSMARITSGQTPKQTYEIFDYFAKKLALLSNDVIILYTNGLYFNAEDISHELRVKFNQKIIQHAASLRKLIDKKKQYMPNAFHYLPIDYIILNSKYFELFFSILKKREKEDTKFKECIKKDMGDRKYTEATVNFILEEIAVAHIIKQRLVEFPRTLVRNDMWRLIAYPGTHLESDAYQWKNKILPQTDKVNPYAGAHYDFNKKKLCLYHNL
nr:hypothetical protein [Nanoarchaeum sp.]